MGYKVKQSQVMYRSSRDTETSSTKYNLLKPWKEGVGIGKYKVQPTQFMEKAVGTGRHKVQDTACSSHGKNQ